MKPTEIKKKTKKELCQVLGVRWKEPTAPLLIIHKEKVCSDRNSRSYPHRYSKEELIRLIISNNPYVNKGRLKVASFETLCHLARLPYIKTARENAFHGIRRLNERGRYYQQQQQGGQPQQGITDDVRCMARSRRPPFQYQERVVRHFQNHRGLIAVHSVGSGKTMTAVLASQCYLDDHPQGKVVVVSPTSLIANFKKEMSAFGDLRHQDRYEFFSFQGFFYKYKDHPRQCRDQMLIVDEAHNLRTEYNRSKSGKEKGKISKIITQCAEKADRVLLLTATPLINKNEDIAPLLNMVRDNPTLNNRITTKLLRKQKDEEFLRQVGMCKFSFYERQKQNDDYPTTTEEDVFLVMKPQFYHMYSKVEREVMDEDILRTFGEESHLKPFFNGIRRAVNILSGLPETDMMKSEKIRWIVDNLRNNPHKKTVIFSQFLDSGVDAIQSKLKREFPDMNVAHITGNQTKKRRAEVVSQYNRNELDVLFISKAGGEGLDLKGTRQIILMESGWNENTERQVIGRGVRFRSHYHLPKDEQNVVIYRLYHIKKDEDPSHVLSPGYEIQYNDPSAWPSADLLLKKISHRKQLTTDRFLGDLKKMSIEKNPRCRG